MMMNDDIIDLAIIPEADLDDESFMYGNQIKIILNNCTNENYEKNIFNSIDSIRYCTYYIHYRKQRLIKY